MAFLWKKISFTCFWDHNAPLGPKVPTQEPPQKWFSVRKHDERGWKSTQPLNWKRYCRGLRCGHFDTSTHLVTVFMQFWHFLSWTHVVKSKFKEQSSWCVLGSYLALIHQMVYKGSNTCGVWLSHFHVKNELNRSVVDVLKENMHEERGN